MVYVIYQTDVFYNISCVILITCNLFFATHDVGQREMLYMVYPQQINMVYPQQVKSMSGVTKSILHEIFDISKCGEYV